VPVMIVTGDRDVFQLIDERGLVKVMATARGITETKIYDRQAVIDRYGISPELIPDFYGLKGDTSDNIPGIPGIGDKTASELLQRFGSLEGVLSHVDEISGPKRKQNLIEHAEDARVSKRLATVQRDVAVDFDVAAEAVREPDRSRVREVFREFELRDPLRRLEEALGDPEVAAPAPAADVFLTARVMEGGVADIARVGGAGDELCVQVRASEPPEGALFAEGAPWRFAVAAAGEVLVGDCDGPEEVVAPRRSATSPRGWCTTRCSAPTCWSPRDAATRWPSCAKSGASRVTSPTRWPPTRCCSACWPTGSASRSPSAAWRA
jgi:DNA polymerase-1